VKTKGTLRLHRNEAMELLTLVDELESEAEFHQLVMETRSAFLGAYHVKSEYGWQQAIKDFFRRSQCYSDSFEKKSLSVDTAFQNYCGTFQRRQIQVTYLAPMEFVRFAERFMERG
jgi:hypothetical protein